MPKGLQFIVQLVLEQLEDVLPQVRCCGPRNLLLTLPASKRAKRACCQCLAAGSVRARSGRKLQRRYHEVSLLLQENFLSQDTRCRLNAKRSLINRRV